MGRVALVRFVLLAAGTAAVAPSAPAQDQHRLHLELEELVDLESPSARRKQAAALARRRDAKLEDWLVAMRTFGRFDPLPSGMSVHTVPLRVGKATEETELHVYVPHSVDVATPAPLMLAYHGTGGRGEGMAHLWRAVADRIGMIVLAPSEAGDNTGYRFADRERLSALASLRWIRRRANVDENRVFASGVSRGGHLAWDLALRHPDLFAGIAPMIGGPRLQIGGGQNNLRYVENVAHMAIRDLQGVNDDPGLVFNVELAFEKLLKLMATDVELFLHPDRGHSFDFRAVDWDEFCSTKRRNPDPLRVVRMAARKGEGRSFWVEVMTLDTREVKEDFRPKISQADWNELSKEGRLRFMADLADEKTARLEVRRLTPTRYEAMGRGVARFRLLFGADELSKRETVEVIYNGERKKRTAEPSKSVLLTEFAERFDRTWLPVAEIEVR